MDYQPRLRRPLLDISFYLLTFGGVIVTLSAYQWLPGVLAPVWVLGVILYLGFGLPRWQGRDIAVARAEQAKLTEREKWGFYSRDREGPWLNYINYPLLRIHQPCKGKFFYSEWLIIHDGLIIVNPGYSEVDQKSGTVSYDFTSKRTYAWDGCTPKRWFFWFSLFGTPDWQRCLLKVLTLKMVGNKRYKAIYRDVFWQQAHHASLVHDALYQYLDNLPLAKKEVDALFCDMLKECDFSTPMSFAYRMAVRFFGAKGVDENAPAENSKLKIRDFNIEHQIDHTVCAE